MKKEYQAGFFDWDIRLKRISDLKNPLDSISSLIDWELFRHVLMEGVVVSAEDKGGRPSFDRLMMFKILILQQVYGLSDEQAEFQITDRLSFMNFLGLSITDQVPDARTIWYFREQLTKNGTIDKLFTRFISRLEKDGLILNKGRMIDASFVKAPIQRNSRDENQQIKTTGEKPADWSEGKARQKDVDANWTKKNDVSFYGYKNHIKVDKNSKLIVDFQTTPASVHDSQVMPELLDEKDKGQRLYADSAYHSKDIDERIKELHIIPRIHEKGSRNHPLTNQQQASNKNKSKCRARVEHVFASLKNFGSRMQVKCIGLQRATAVITLQNITYNIMRVKYLAKLQGRSLPI